MCLSFLRWNRAFLFLLAFCHRAEPFLEYPVPYFPSDAWMPWIGHTFKECIYLSTRSPELGMNVLVVTRCVTSQIRPCLLRPEKSLKQQIHTFSSGASAYCGWMALKSDSADQHVPLTRNIAVVDNFKIRMSFLKFDTPWTKYQEDSCSSTGLKLTAPRNGYKERLCGKRSPWHLDINSDQLRVKVYGHPLAARYIDITLVYELIHKDVVIHDDEEWRLLSPGESKFMSLTTNLIDGYMYTWHIVTYPSSYLHLHFPMAASVAGVLESLTVYDGPGELSPELPVHLVSETLSNVMSSSSFHLTVTLATKRTGQLESHYTSESFKEDSTDSHPIQCRFFPKYMSSAEISLSSPKESKSNRVCVAAMSHYEDGFRLDISSFSFLGLTTIYNNLLFPCQHGGLYLYDTSPMTANPQMDFCNAVGKYPPEKLYVKQNFVMVAVWFAGYTHGHLSISLQQEKCNVYSRPCTNFDQEEERRIEMETWSPRCNQVRMSFQDVILTNGRKQLCGVRLLMEPVGFEFMFSDQITTMKVGPLKVSSIAEVKPDQNHFKEDIQTILLLANSSAGEMLANLLQTGDSLDWSGQNLMFLDIFGTSNDWQPPFTVTLSIDLLSAFMETYQLPSGDVTRLVDTEKTFYLLLDYSSGTKNFILSVPETHVTVAVIAYDSDCPVRCRNDSIYITENYFNFTGIKVTFTWQGKDIDNEINWFGTGPHSTLEVLIHRTLRPECSGMTNLRREFCSVKVFFLAIQWPATNTIHREDLRHHPPGYISWLMAEKVCVQNGSHLVSIQPETYNYGNQYFDFQNAMGNSFGFSIFFIGLHNMDEGIYKWTDGRAVSMTYWVKPFKSTSPQQILRREDGTTVDVSTFITDKDVLEIQDYLKQLVATPQPSQDLGKQCTAGVIGANQQVAGWIKIPCTKVLYAAFFCGSQLTTSGGKNRGHSAFINLTNENGLLSGILLNPSMDCPFGWLHYTSGSFTDSFTDSCFSVLGLKTHSIVASEIHNMCSEKGGRPTNLNITNYMYELESFLKDVYNCYALSNSSACKAAKSWEYEESFKMPFHVILEHVLTFNFSHTLDKVFQKGINIYDAEDRHKDLLKFLKNIFSRHFVEGDTLPIAFSGGTVCGVLSRVEEKLFWYPQNCDQPLFADYIICETDLQIVTSQCSPITQFTCGDGSCIIRQRVCDRRDDCFDSSDETGCDRQSTDEHEQCSSHEFQCWPSEICIGAHLLCDAVTDCPDGSDETYCSKDVCRESEHMCPGGECISQDKICDGVMHCTDRSDELSCEFSCQGFICLSGTCIPLTKQLDFVPDCEHGEDELPIDRNESKSYDVSSNPACLVDDDGYATASCRGFNNEQREPCFRINDMCILQTYEHADNTGCTNALSLLHCIYVLCPGRFKCLGNPGYCIPLYTVCDGVVHCPDGGDEVGCAKLSCPGMLKCTGERICVPQANVCDGSLQCHQSGDDETLCEQCPDGCDCQGYTMQCNSSSSFSSHPGNKTFSATALTLTNVSRSLKVDDLDFVTDLVYFHLADTLLVRLISPDGNYWEHHIDLKYMNLRHNKLELVGEATFRGLHNLHFLDLSDNRIRNLPKNIFKPLLLLQVLLLPDNDIKKLEREHFRSLSSLESLDVMGNNLLYIESTTFHDLEQLQFVWSNIPRICCLVPSSVTCSAPEYLVSTCQDLLGVTSQRVFIWLLGVLGALANSLISVKYGYRGRSFKKLTSNEKAYNMLIANIAWSDILMNIHLLALGGMDFKYMGTFYLYVDEWRKGFGCKLLGVISLVSLESTLYTLFLLALMRTAAVLYPIEFRQSEGKQGKMFKACLWGWLLAMCIATMPLYLYPQLTGSVSIMPNGVCMLLDFSQAKGVNIELFLSVFVSVNGAIIAGIITCYVCIFRKLFKTSSEVTAASAINARKARDAKMASKIFLVIFVDLMTWLPILICISLSLAHVSLPNDLITWIVVLVLPINSVVNPFLYSLEVIRGVVSTCLRQKV